MGYRSEVVICVNKLGREFLNKSKDSELINDILSKADIHKEMEGNHLYHFDDIKWYEEDYDDIAALMQALKEMTVVSDTEENSPMCYFIRLGENFDDLEEIGYWHNNVFGANYVRRIEY